MLFILKSKFLTFKTFYKVYINVGLLYITTSENKICAQSFELLSKPCHLFYVISSNTLAGLALAFLRETHNELVIKFGARLGILMLHLTFPPSFYCSTLYQLHYFGETIGLRSLKLHFFKYMLNSAFFFFCQVEWFWISEVYCVLFPLVLNCNITIITILVAFCPYENRCLYTPVLHIQDYSSRPRYTCYLLHHFPWLINILLSKIRSWRGENHSDDQYLFWIIGTIKRKERSLGWRTKTEGKLTT